MPRKKVVKRRTKKESTVPTSIPLEEKIQLAESEAQNLAEAVQYQYKLPQNEVRSTTPKVYKRGVAFIIDFLIFYFIVFQPFFMIFNSMAGIPFSDNLTQFMKYVDGNPEVKMKINIAFAFGSILFLIYLASFQLFFRATPGMNVMSLEVKGEINLWKALMRNITITIFAPIAWIDLVSMFLTPRKQRLAEIISGTFVEERGVLKMDYEVYG